LLQTIAAPSGHLSHGKKFNQEELMPRETLKQKVSLWARLVSSTPLCLSKAKLFTGKILGSDREGDEKGEEEDFEAKSRTKDTKKACNSHTPTCRELALSYTSLSLECFTLSILPSCLDHAVCSSRLLNQVRSGASIHLFLL
jgi:hypothetical protein